MSLISITFNELFFYREFEGEGYVIVINVDGTEQPVDLSVFDIGPKGELTVIAAAPNSAFAEG